MQVRGTSWTYILHLEIQASKHPNFSGIPQLRITSPTVTISHSSIHLKVKLHEIASQTPALDLIDSTAVAGTPQN